MPTWLNGSNLCFPFVCSDCWGYSQLLHQKMRERFPQEYLPKGVTKMLIGSKDIWEKPGGGSKKTALYVRVLMKWNHRHHSFIRRNKQNNDHNDDENERSLCRDAEPCPSSRSQELSYCWDGRPFGRSRHGPKSEGLQCSFPSVELVPV